VFAPPTPCARDVGLLSPVTIWRIICRRSSVAIAVVARLPENIVTWRLLGFGVPNPSSSSSSESLSSALADTCLAVLGLAISSSSSSAPLSLRTLSEVPALYNTSYIRCVSESCLTCSGLRARLLLILLIKFCRALCRSSLILSFKSYFI